jgi:hypothetical protein
MAVPSVRAKKLASSPTMNSSITTSAPAAPKLPENMSTSAASASAFRLGDDDALACGEAIRLDHDGEAEFRQLGPRLGE